MVCDSWLFFCMFLNNIDPNLSLQCCKYIFAKALTTIHTLDIASSSRYKHIEFNKHQMLKKICNFNHHH